MAKKKAAKSNVNGRAKKQTKRQADRVLRSGPVRTRPRTRPKDQPLPGMEDARIQALDDVAGTMSDLREQINDLRTQEGETMTSALNLMRKHDKQSWRAHGVEFVRVPGEERLRVRTSKERATAEVMEADEPIEDKLDPMDGLGVEAAELH